MENKFEHEQAFASSWDEHKNLSADDIELLKRYINSNSGKPIEWILISVIKELKSKVEAIGELTKEIDTLRKNNECDCEDPDNGFVSMYCPIHNTSPYKNEDKKCNKPHKSYNENDMSKRFYVVCAAMQGILSNSALLSDGTVGDHQWVCEQSYAIADKMIEMEKESSNS